ncbi:phosphatidate cytidylyltransferase [Candidatus Pelagibacter sp. HIMB1521]|uniref:phosphatidate cytidylyltransferase n=1 Tax=Candidatus Pelagibacter sp. HIMB1521 TaxID=3413344 RepID=UPI003F8346A8
MTKNNPLRIFGLIFLTISFFTIYKLSEDVRYLFLVIFICISTDIGGYVFGKILKGPKLIKISPNKTYAGMIGSYVLTLIFTPLFLEFLQFNNMSLSRAIIVSFIISSISQMGDIVISFFKRKAKVKNTGKLIPGHGGILDRIDGMIFAVPTFYILNLLQIF